MIGKLARLQPRKLLLLLCSSFGAAAASFALQLCLSRLLSKENFGLLAEANAVCLVVGTFASSGAASLLLRKASVCPTLYKENLGVARRTQNLLAVIGLVVTIAVLFCNKVGLVTSALLSISVISLATQSLLTSLGQIKSCELTTAISQVGLPLVRLLSCVPLIWLDRELSSAALCLGVANGVCVILYRSVYIRDVIPGLRIKVREIGSFLRQSVRYSINGTLNIAQLQMSIALVGFLNGSTSAAHLAVTNTMLNAVYIVPNTVFNLYLLKKYHQLSNSEMATPLRHSLLAFVVGAVFAMILADTAAPIFGLLFGMKYLDAVSLLKIVCIAIPFRFLSTALGATLLSERLVKKKVTAAGAGFVLLALLLVVLKPLGDRGVGLSLILSEVTIAGLYFFLFTVREKHEDLDHRLLRY